MEETVTESNLSQRIDDFESDLSQRLSNLSQQMNDFSIECKVAIEKLSNEFKELFEKRAKADKILRFEFAITLLIVWIQIAVNLFDW